MLQVINASAGGTFLAVDSRTAVLAGARLVAAEEAATAVIRETDGSGRVLCVLAAAVGEADESAVPVVYQGQVHVTLAGTDATLLLYQR